MMIRFLVGLLTATFTTVSLAGLVEVNISQYIRESGSPYAQSLEITLENDGEIRVSNINLQDADVELAESTQIYLNGSSILSPFQVPYGGYAVFPLSAGTHYLEVTLRGKPGGGVEVAFYENKPDAPSGKGWELLDDGTVLHRKTGLIWHRFVGSPGVDRALGYAFDQICADTALANEVRCSMSISKYIDNLNGGVYGTDKVTGNAGYTDWRAPTIQELASTISYVVTGPPLSGKDGEEINYPPPRRGWQGGMQPGDPLYVCQTFEWEAEQFGIQPCNPDWQVWKLITNNPPAEPWARGSEHMGVDLTYGFIWNWWIKRGSVWPVRGGMPE